jgi:hypothetical protein
LLDQLTTLGETAAQIKKTFKDGTYPLSSPCLRKGMWRKLKRHEMVDVLESKNHNPNFCSTSLHPTKSHKVKREERAISTALPGAGERNEKNNEASNSGGFIHKQELLTKVKFYF